MTAAENGEAALGQLAGEPSEVVILDLGLPDMDGKEVIQRIREWSDAPIIVLSARDLESEKIARARSGGRRLREQARGGWASCWRGSGR